MLEESAGVSPASLMLPVQNLVVLMLARVAGRSRSEIMLANEESPSENAYVMYMSRSEGRQRRYPQDFALSVLHMYLHPEFFITSYVPLGTNGGS